MLRGNPGASLYGSGATRVSALLDAYVAAKAAIRQPISLVIIGGPSGSEYAQRPQWRSGLFGTLKAVTLFEDTHAQLTQP